MSDRNIAATFAALDTEKLFAIAMRVVSNETVEEVHQFAALVKKAADLVVKSGVRIVTGEAPRSLETAAQVELIVAEYNA